nr:hypothetical protein [uncultured Treponema sp.]
MGLVALISVILIYQSNEQIIKTQKKYRKELEEFNKSIIGAFTIMNDMTAKATLTGFLTRRFLKLQESFLLQKPSSSFTVKEPSTT